MSQDVEKEDSKTERKDENQLRKKDTRQHQICLVVACYYEKRFDKTIYRLKLGLRGLFWSGLMYPRQKSKFFLVR